MSASSFSFSTTHLSSSHCAASRATSSFTVLHSTLHTTTHSTQCRYRQLLRRTTQHPAHDDTRDTVSLPPAPSPYYTAPCTRRHTRHSVVTASILHSTLHTTTRSTQCRYCQHTTQHPAHDDTLDTVSLPPAYYTPPCTQRHIRHSVVTFPWPTAPPRRRPGPKVNKL